MHRETRVGEYGHLARHPEHEPDHCGQWQPFEYDGELSAEDWEEIGRLLASPGKRNPKTRRKDG